MIEPTLRNYDIEYRFFENGDFGALNQVAINSIRKGGGIDFWEFRWLGVNLYGYERDGQLLNILLEPHECNEKEKALEKFIYLLKIREMNNFIKSPANTIPSDSTITPKFSDKMKGIIKRISKSVFRQLAIPSLFEDQLTSRVFGIVSYGIHKYKLA